MSQRTGKSQWTLLFVAEILRRRSATVCIAYGDALPELWQTDHARIRRFARGARWHLQVSRAVRNAHCVYLAPTSFIVPALLPRTSCCVPVVHDLIAFRREPHAWKAKLLEHCTLPLAIKKAAHVLVTSAATQRDLSELFPAMVRENISRVYAGPSSDHPEPSVPDGTTILCPATLCPRKNQLRLIEAYASISPDLRSQYRLVLVGARGWHDREILRAIACTDGVEWRKYVPDREYSRLLSTCTVLAFPSLYEGFGLPVLDALQRGTPVLTSARGSLQEVVGTRGVLVDPESIDAIAQGLTLLLRDHGLRNRLRTQGPVQASRFSWKSTVDIALRAIDSVAKR